MKKGIVVLMIVALLMTAGFIQQSKANEPELRKVNENEVQAIVYDIEGDVVAVEIKTRKGIEIYKFYGDNFTIGEEITLIMVDDMIIGVKERR